MKIESAVGSIKNFPFFVRKRTISLGASQKNNLARNLGQDSLFSDSPLPRTKHPAWEKALKAAPERIWMAGQGCGVISKSPLVTETRLAGGKTANPSTELAG